MTAETTIFYCGIFRCLRFTVRLILLQVRSAFKRMRQRQLLSRGSDNASSIAASVSWPEYRGFTLHAHTKLSSVRKTSDLFGQSPYSQAV